MSYHLKLTYLLHQLYFNKKNSTTNLLQLDPLEQIYGEYVKIKYPLLCNTYRNTHFLFLGLRSMQAGFKSCSLQTSIQCSVREGGSSESGMPGSLLYQLYWQACNLELTSREVLKIPGARYARDRFQSLHSVILISYKGPYSQEIHEEEFGLIDAGRGNCGQKTVEATGWNESVSV